VARQEIEPYLSDRRERIVLDGPPVSLRPKLALSLGMIIHELATNAAKYGSLSVAIGSLEMAWSLESRSGGQTYLVIDWTERGGPAVKKSDRRGLGLTLIEREMGHGLDGKARIDFEESGLRANLRIPLPRQ
jgi:two-component system CheB/CheR fusion protein